MIKLPINTNIPLETANGEYDAHGEAVWAYWKQKGQGSWLYAYDKYWRKVPTKTSNYAAEFATEEIREAAQPITWAEKSQVLEEATDDRNFDHLFDIEELPEDITGGADPSEPIEPEQPVTIPTDRDEIAKGFVSLAEAMKHFAKAFGVNTEDV